MPYKGENYEAETADAGKALKKYRGKLERVEEPAGAAGEISGHVLMVIRKY